MNDITAISGIILTPLKQVAAEKGDILHVMRRTDPGFADFGEAYISTIKHNAIKGWKRHREMILNLVVPVGAVEFRAIDGREAGDKMLVGCVCLSRENYYRLTVPPGIWLSFRGAGPSLNVVINLANILHEQNESDNLSLEDSAMPKVWKSAISSV